MQTRHIFLLTALLVLTLVNYAITSCQQNSAQPTPTNATISSSVVPSSGEVESGTAGQPPNPMQNTIPSQMDAEETTLQPDPDSAGGIVMQVENLTGNRDPLTWEVQPGAAARGQVTLKNYTDLDTDLELICFIDYLQTPCFETFSQAHITVDLPSGKQQIINITTSGLDEGLHDLLIVAFYLPDLHLADPRFREESRFMYTFRRANLIVGQTEAPPAIRYQSYTTPDKLAARGIYTLALTQENPENPAEAPWQVSELAAGTTTSFSLRWNNPQTQPATFALIGLLDYQQVPVSGDMPVLFGQLPPQGRADIAGQVTAPATPGSHEFVLLVIENPFTALAQQATDEMPQPTFAYSTDRVLLQVP